MIFFLVIAISLLSVLPLAAQGYFPMHDDLQVMRIFEMEKCFMDGQFPCRWVPDMGFGFGQPMFNFYSATPYYLGILIRLLTPLSIMGTVKLLFALTLVGSGVTMYLLAKEFFGKQTALLVSVLYVFAPYRALDVYVRGALSENFSLMLLPLLFLAVYKLLKKPNFKSVAFTSVIIALQITTHNVSTLMYFFFTGVWGLYWLAKSFSFKKIYATVVSGLIGFGMSAFFILPIIFERQYIQDEFFTKDYFFFGAHFVSLRQLFIDRSFGFGPSIFGDQDTMSFQIGWPHWLLVPLGVLIVFVFRSKKWKDKLSLVLLFAVLFTLSIFLTHQKSFPIWNNFSTITFVQFPWRFLGPAAFFASLAAGGLGYLPKVIKQISIFGIIILTILLNAFYFKPEIHFFEDTDVTKLSGEQFLIQQKSAILDYLPIYAEKAPESLAPTKPIIIEGDTNTQNYSTTSSTFFFDAEVNEDSTLQIPIMYYPGWEVYSLVGQGERISTEPGGELGSIEITLPKGKYMIHGRFTDTPLRSAANVITLSSVALLAFGFLLNHNDNKFLGLK